MKINKIKILKIIIALYLLYDFVSKILLLNNGYFETYDKILLFSNIVIDMVIYAKILN